MTTLLCIPKKGSVANQTIGFPIIGDVTFDNDSKIKIEDHLVDDFLKVQCGFEFQVIGKKKKKEDEKDSDDLNLNNKTNEEVVKKEQERKAYEAGLKELSADDFKALLSIYPEEETKILKSKKAKFDFLIMKQFEETNK